MKTKTAEFCTKNNATRATAEAKRAQAAADEAAKLGATIAVEEDAAQDDGRDPDAGTIAYAAYSIIENAEAAAHAAHAAKQYARYATEASRYANTPAATKAAAEAAEAAKRAKAAADRADEAAASATAKWFEALYTE